MAGRVTGDWSSLPPMHACLFIGAAVLMAVGCGEPKPAVCPVSGSVTYRGKALPGGTVMFMREGGGRSVMGVIDSQGNYRLEAEPGSYRVELNDKPPITDVGESPDDEFVAPEMVGPPTPSQWRPILPHRFRRFGTSGLMATVSADGVNQIDFHLE